MKSGPLISQWNRAMNSFHLLFAIAVGFVGSAIYETYRRATQHDPVAPLEKVSIIIFSALLGIFLLAASVPGAFFEQPYWLTEKFYWVVEKAIGLFR